MQDQLEEMGLAWKHDELPTALPKVYRGHHKATEEGGGQKKPLEKMWTARI